VAQQCAYLYGGEESAVHPTKEQKLKFKRAVQIVNELVGKED
jgi:hypothetical protein